MRIQHNIAALNSHRNLTNNNSAVAKNLEKLSSGYRINRAGDDAAGLAISEKMRAQITGLETAQKNAQDGISLVQTAEGALTEVHSMLNRMVELADQSANGTYDNEVDRANLQKEITALKDEIDRIADATNFNGINLLDGSLSGKGATSAVSTATSDLELGEIEATKGTYTIDANAATLTGIKDGDKIGMNIGLSDGTSINIELTYKLDDKKNATLVDENGKVYGEIENNSGAAGDVDEKNTGEAFAAALKDKVGDTFKVTVNTADGKITFEAKAAGANTPQVKSVGYVGVDGTAKETAVKEDTKAADAYNYLDLTKVTLLEDDGSNADKAVFEVNGQKFAIGKITTDASKLDKDVTFIGITTDLTTANDIKQIASEIAQKTGLTVEGNANWNHDGDNSTAAINALAFKPGTSTKGNGGLTLQIGDTSAEFNQLRVSINDMHTKALGIDGIDIGTQAGAKAAVDKIKSAINSVSSTRGDLGAIQNRLEHTINNLSVTTENMTAAESRIRDVDMAKEMMAYTKNNILVQASQAMLAQANQLPQGVLQLLQ